MSYASLVSNHRIRLADALLKERHHSVSVFIGLRQHQGDVRQDAFLVAVVVSHAGGFEPTFGDTVLRNAGLRRLAHGLAVVDVDAYVFEGLGDEHRSITHGLHGVDGFVFHQVVARGNLPSKDGSVRQEHREPSKLAFFFNDGASLWPI